MTDTTVVTETVNNVVTNMTLLKALTTLATLAVCLGVTKIVDAVMGKVLSRGKLDKRIGSFLRRGVKTLMLVVTVLVVADQLGVPITSLVALLSVLGLAVTLAVQTVLSGQQFRRLLAEAGFRGGAAAGTRYQAQILFG